MIELYQRKQRRENIWDDGFRSESILFYRLGPSHHPIFLMFFTKQSLINTIETKNQYLDSNRYFFIYILIFCMIRIVFLVIFFQKWTQKVIWCTKTHRIDKNKSLSKPRLMGVSKKQVKKTKKIFF